MSNTRHIPIVNWRAQKLADALSQVDFLMSTLFDTLIFETIIDYLREDSGFPGALPLRELTQASPMLPSPAYSLPPLRPTADLSVICPICRKEIEAWTFLEHVDRCAKTVPSAVAVACQFFNGSDEGEELNEG
jgi:hypothetical protein